MRHRRHEGHESAQALGIVGSNPDTSGERGWEACARSCGWVVGGGGPQSCARSTVAAPAWRPASGVARSGTQAARRASARGLQR